MGAAESKDQIPTPETPQYLKYSHLKELRDPRSPVVDGDEPRTPIRTVDCKKSMVDPRSPNYLVPRTPIFMIPEPDFKQVNDECSIAKNLDENAVQQGGNGDEGNTSPEDKIEPDSTKTGTVALEVESSPEKVPSAMEFSDKGYLINKPKGAGGAKKKRRRRRNRKPKDDENSGVYMLKSAKNFKGKSLDQGKRSPLMTRNFIPLEESPTLEKLITKTRKLSVGGKRGLDFHGIENMGQENIAAVFSP